MRPDTAGVMYLVISSSSVRPRFRSQNGQISSRHLESYWSPQIIPRKFIVEHESTSITGAWWTSSTDALMKSTCARLQHRQHIAQIAHEPKSLHENKQWTIHKQCIPRTWSVKSIRKKCLHFVGISFTTSTCSHQTAIIRHSFFSFFAKYLTEQKCGNRIRHNLDINDVSTGYKSLCGAQD